MEYGTLEGTNNRNCAKILKECAFYRITLCEIIFAFYKLAKMNVSAFICIIYDHFLIIAIVVFLGCFERKSRC